MDGLESALARARDLEPAALADSIQQIGFECTRCGHCCTGDDADAHTATIFPDEVRSIVASRDEEWEAVARPIPYGLTDGRGETFEWALQTDACGDCRFLAETGDGTACTIYSERPLICQTYPFSVAIGLGVGEEGSAGNDQEVNHGSTQPGTEQNRATENPIVGHEEGVVEQVGAVRAHDCPGLGTDIDPEQALELAETLKQRTIEELEQAIGVRSQYDSKSRAEEPVVVFDSEGAKRPDGTRITGSN